MLLKNHRLTNRCRRILGGKSNEAPAHEAKDQQEQAGGDDVFADISFTDDEGVAGNADKKVNTVDDSVEAGDGGSSKKKTRMGP